MSPIRLTFLLHFMTKFQFHPFYHKVFYNCTILDPQFIFVSAFVLTWASLLSKISSPFCFVDTIPGHNLPAVFLKTKCPPAWWGAQRSDLEVLALGVSSAFWVYLLPPLKLAPFGQFFSPTSWTMVFSPEQLLQDFCISKIFMIFFFLLEILLFIFSPYPQPPPVNHEDLDEEQSFHLPSVSFLVSSVLIFTKHQYSFLFLYTSHICVCVCVFT